MLYLLKYYGIFSKLLIGYSGYLAFICYNIVKDYVTLSKTKNI